MTGSAYLLMVVRDRSAIDDAAVRYGEPQSRHRLGQHHLALWCGEGLRLHVSPDGTGLIIGTVFDHGGVDWRPDGQAWAGALDDFPNRLATRHWGRWTGIKLEPERGTIIVARDPSGGLPCYYRASAFSFALGSDARSIVKAAGGTGEVDWAQVAARLLRPSLRTTRTAIIGVHELLPGHVLAVDGLRLQAAQTCFWTPWDFVRQSISADPAMLAARIDQCVAALVRRHPKVILSLSGGLDSSIVAAALAASGCDTVCLSLFSRSVEGDERGYAEAVSDMLGLALQSWPYDDHPVDPFAQADHGLPRPSARLFAREADRARAALARELGASAIFGGDGGDETFCLLQSVSPLIDRLRTEGLSAGAYATLDDLARLTRCSHGLIAYHVLRKLLRRPFARWPATPDFLTKSALHEAQGQPHHPWLIPPPGALPGKLAHVAGIVRAQDYVDLHATGDVPYILPLLAQPLVEDCLSLPSWLWCQGGINRSLTRSAYAGRLPQRVLKRGTKGGVDDFCVRIVEEHLPDLRNRLLSGRLVAEGVVDPHALDAAMASVRTSSTKAHRLLALADAENWAQAWISLTTAHHSLPV